MDLFGVLKLAILISGRGSNLRSILQAIKARRLVGVEARVVITDNPRASGIAIAKKFKIATEILPSSELRGWSYDKNLLSLLEKYNVLPNDGLICLAGYMRILSPEFVQRYKMRIINVHPSLLPSFPGLHAQKQALEYGVKVSGCTIHFVDEGVDSGSILLQQPVRVLDSDSEETLSERILIQEHKLYPEAINLIAGERIVLMGRKAMLI
ncbi:MAG: phosphoribosylglycinamide formyltransferase [Thermoproteota archaeon]|nr:phosphoribosylglycinamide formyltransferase [Thermoproteota archaeon]